MLYSLPGRMALIVVLAAGSAQAATIGTFGGMPAIGELSINGLSAAGGEGSFFAALANELILGSGLGIPLMVAGRQADRQTFGLPEENAFGESARAVDFRAK